MLAALSLSLALIQAPSMVRTWTLPTGYSTQILGSRNGVCYYSTPRLVGAVRESDGYSLWAKSFSYIPAADLGSNFIVISQGEEKKASLVVLDLKNGAQLATRAMPEAESLAVDSNMIYTVAAGTLRVFTSKLAPVWTAKLAEKASRMRGELAVSGDILAVALGDNKWVVFDKKTRKKLWELRDQYAGLYPMVLSKGLLLLRGDKDGVFDARTGRKVWDLKDTDWAVLSGDVCLLQEGTDYVARDWKTGRQLWRLPGAPDYSGGQDEASVSADGSIFFAGGDHLTAMSLTGQKLWTAQLNRPEIARKDRWIVSDGERLLGYGPGKMMRVPTEPGERERLALRLVRDFEVLDDRERDLLIPLAREAIKPLLARYAQWAKEYEALEGKRDSDTRGRGQALYGLLEGDSGRRLDKMLTKADTPLLIDTIRQVKSEWWRDRILVPLLLEHGDVDQAAPFFLAQLRQEKQSEQGSSSLEAISKSSHPEAVKFLIDALNNPKAPSAWRRAAFIRLAGTGGDAGVAAVRNAMPKPGPRPRWQTRVVPGATRGSSKPKEAKDSKGRTWVLFQSGVLGNYSDYYLAQKIGAKYGEPIFLGFYDGRTWGKEAPKEHRRVPMAKLVATEWIKLFPDDAVVRKDADGDGLTDLVETRLGTDPANPDTDKDGLRDDVDPCPNAAPRTLGDREKIVAAAVAAQFFENDWGVSAVISVEKVEPFEMAGYPRPLVWTLGRREGVLGSMYGGGVNSISFGPVIRDFDQKIPEDADWLEISADGKTAHTMISRYSGGLNGEGVEVVLRKVGDEWFVIDLITRFVS
ncbi:MAG: PQQ-binding-like beta-propeller repeat protein [Methanoregulaceae archaeon]|nr:PQQ-binding-like beta-propeller repeat protein [Methanoregulaceae archaeon]